ncbi:MAG: hypothetical protein EB117_16960 [Betaproteobacteria bacterium]|nr:hypothetical protein [Betaproteobacteria bacterium]
MGSHFSNERGDTNDNIVELGLKIYGLSCWSESRYDFIILGYIATVARMIGLMFLSAAHTSQSLMLGFCIRTIVKRFAV